MKANDIVPGISAYPDLEKQLQQRISNLTAGRGCSSCNKAKLYREFSRKMRNLVERDKLRGRR